MEKKTDFRIAQRAAASLLIAPGLLASGFAWARQKQAVELPFGARRRASEAPLLSPRGTGWESAGVFNPAAVSIERPFSLLHQTKVAPRTIGMLHRAQDAAGTSRIGYAESKDGIHFARRGHTPSRVFWGKSAEEIEKAGDREFGRAKECVSG